MAKLQNDLVEIEFLFSYKLCNSLHEAMEKKKKIKILRLYIPGLRSQNCFMQIFIFLSVGNFLVKHSHYFGTNCIINSI